MLGEQKSTPFPLLARAPLCSPEGFFYSLLSGTRGPQAEPPLSWDCAQRLWSWDCQEGPPDCPVGSACTHKKGEQELIAFLEGLCLFSPAHLL